MKSKIGFAGDVELSEISILSGNGLIQNILPQVEGIELYEDLFGYFISGTGFGTAIEIQCLACGEKKDITDYSNW